MCANGLLIIRCQFILVKIKLNAFFSVRKKTLPGLSMTYENNRIKQYLGCYLDTYLSGEPMAMKSLKKDQCKATVLI